VIVNEQLAKLDMNLLCAINSPNKIANSPYAMQYFINGHACLKFWISCYFEGACNYQQFYAHFTIAKPIDNDGGISV